MKEVTDGTLVVRRTLGQVFVKSSNKGHWILTERLVAEGAEINVMLFNLLRCSVFEL
jgi:hypothetical protein